MSTRSQDSSTKQDHQPPSLGKSSSDFARNGRGGQSTQQQIPSPLRPGFGGMRTRRSVDDPFTSNTARDTSRLTERSPSKSASPQKTPKLDPNAVGGGDPHATAEDMASSFASSTRRARARLRSPWACSPLTLLTAVVALSLAGGIVHSFLTRQLDPKGCAMSYMRPSFAKYTDFDTEHTRFASKYSLYLYREGGIDEDPRVSQRWLNMRSFLNLIWVRSRVYQFSSSREMPAATSKSDHWPPRPLSTLMKRCELLSTGTDLAKGLLIFFPSISMKT